MSTTIGGCAGDVPLNVSNGSNSLKCKISAVTRVSEPPPRTFAKTDTSVPTLANFVVTKPSTCRTSEPLDEVSFGATINPETGAAINRRTSKIGIRWPALITIHK